MLATNHVLAGASVGAVVGDPLVAVVVGVASHILMDAIPHWGGNQREPLDHNTFLRVARIDGFTLLAVFALLAIVAAPDIRWAVLAGAFGALAPDLDKPWEHFFGDRVGHRPLYGYWFARFNAVLQKESPTRWWVEVAAATLLTSSSVVLLIA
jgi:hypothetical protein